MQSDFPRVLSLLRKEKGISQKEAAEKLGVSQALLSHYEKGIRECGLDFLIRAADFYNVSTDYLLGRSADPEGLTIAAEDIPEPDSAGKEKCPSISVIVPFVVPFTTTLTPKRGSPFESVTIPVTVRVCCVTDVGIVDANAEVIPAPLIRQHNAKLRLPFRKSKFLFIMLLLFR